MDYDICTGIDTLVPSPEKARLRGQVREIRDILLKEGWDRTDINEYLKQILELD